jgi:uncharacterized protein
VGVEEQARMVAALLGSLRLQHPASKVTLIETHISFVMLAGGLAYKIKKAVNLGFVDFTTLARRRFFCDEELRLNRRLAPALYLGVMPVTGTPQQPAIGGAGSALDWAVKMRAFPQGGLWEQLATHGALGPPQIDALAEAVCAFHRDAAIAEPAGAYGHAAGVRAPVRDTLQALAPICGGPEEARRLAVLNRWEAQAFEALQQAFDARLRSGAVRECHGDLHLGNVTQLAGVPTMFDCLEFSPALRWTDVMSDIGFMAMDLQCHGLPGLAHRFVNASVECSDDHVGLRVLRYYMVYRALVRAKVAAPRPAQAGSSPGAAREPAGQGPAREPWQRYFDLAAALSRPRAPVLMLTHGCSGSGKTRLTQTLLEQCGAIRIRADVQRKRLFGLPALARSEPALKARLYSNEATEATQARLRERAALVLGSGYPVILDATFLSHAHRQQARALADDLGVEFVILDFQARAATLRARVRQRLFAGDDASEADLSVLESQLANAQPLRAQEQAAAFVFDADATIDDAGSAARWAPLLQRLGAAPS